MPTRRQLRLVEFALWVLAASAIVIAAGLALGFLLGRDLLTGKRVLFVVGFLIFGLGSLLIQPSRPRPDRESEPHVGREGGRIVGNGDGEVPDEPVGEGTDAVREQFETADTHQHRFEARLQEVGPLADHDLPFGQRIDRSYKIFVTGLVVLAFSFAMEVVGIQV